MRDIPPLRIAILTHSTNPRGGVVHALDLGDALVRLGHEATVHAPDAGATGFFRATLCRTVSVATSPAGADLRAVVRARIADYLRHFETATSRRFDIFHAQDSISGNALADLASAGLIGSFARTVHHLDVFDEPELMALQARAVAAADRHFVVSRLWQDQLATQFGAAAQLVGNGVDLTRYARAAAPRDPVLRDRLNLGIGPIFLSVGGIEARKNTLRILHAFGLVRVQLPAAQLVIAGGASLLDHGTYGEEFSAAFTASGLPANAVIKTGPLPEADFAALYRLADALVFPSLKEGFGLVVLEAMASGLPVVTSRIAPFTEYLGNEDVAWCDPFDVHSIAGAMTNALGPCRRAALIDRGMDVARKHDWRKIASAHLPTYASMREYQNA